MAEQICKEKSVASDSAWQPEHGNKAIVREREIVERFRKRVDPMHASQQPVASAEQSEREWKANLSRRLHSFLAVGEPSKP